MADFKHFLCFVHFFVKKKKQTILAAIISEKCIGYSKYSDSETDKPHRECPKRAELPDVNIHRHACMQSQINKTVSRLSNMADTFYEKITRCTKVCEHYCALWMLIGWPDKI